MEFNNNIYVAVRAKEYLLSLKEDEREMLIDHINSIIDKTSLTLQDVKTLQKEMHYLRDYYGN